MFGYIVRRALQAIPTVFAITVVVFCLIQLAPGDPMAQYTHGAQLSPEQVQQIRHQLGLDEPLPVQYVKWLGRWIRGDWGSSLFGHGPVMEVIRSYLPNSVILAGTSFLLAILIGVPAGMLAALKEYSWADNLIRALAFIGLCAPVYWVGLMMIALFAAKLHWLPGGGMYTLGTVPTVLDRVKHLIMPALVGAAYSTGVYCRFMRSSLLEVWNLDYIRTARGKGLPERAVVFTHAVRNALLPMVTIAALNLPWILSGSILVESIFSWPGLGRQYWMAARGHDFPVIMSMFTLIAIAVVVSNLLADVLYAIVDPRIRYE